MTPNPILWLGFGLTPKNEPLGLLTRVLCQLALVLIRDVDLEGCVTDPVKSRPQLTTAGLSTRGIRVCSLKGNWAIVQGECGLRVCIRFLVHDTCQFLIILHVPVHKCNVEKAYFRFTGLPSP